MKKQLDILQSAYEKQNEATEKLREIYDCGKELTEEQRNELLRAINSQRSAALSIHQTIQSLKK